MDQVSPADVFGKDVVKYLRKMLGDAAAVIISFGDAIDKQMTLEWRVLDNEICLVAFCRGFCLKVGSIYLNYGTVIFTWMCVMTRVIDKKCADVSALSAELDNLIHGIDYYVHMGSINLYDRKPIVKMFAEACSTIYNLRINFGDIPQLLGATSGDIIPRGSAKYELYWARIICKCSLVFLMDIHTPAMTLKFVKISAESYYRNRYGFEYEMTSGTAETRIAKILEMNRITKEYYIAFSAEMLAEIYRTVRKVAALCHYSEVGVEV